MISKLSRSKSKKTIVYILNFSYAPDSLCLMAENMIGEGYKIEILVNLNSWNHMGSIEDLKKNLSKYSFKFRIKVFKNNRIFVSYIQRKHSSSPIFFDTPYLSTYQIKELINMHKELNFCYINYGLNLANTPNYHYELDDFHKFRFIFINNEYDYQSFVRANVDRNKLVFINNPIIEKLMMTNQNNLKREIKNILWAPHFNDDKVHGWSQLLDSIDDIYQFAKTTPSICFNIRPHPLLDLSNISTPLENHSRATGNSDDQQRVNDLLGLANVNISHNNLITDVLENDLLVTDGVSIIGYWGITHKKIIIVGPKSFEKYASNYKNYLKTLFFTDSQKSALYEKLKYFVENPDEQGVTNESFIEITKLLMPNLESSKITTDRIFRISKLG